MIDPILSLSFSIHYNPGVYALLLGSGVSHSAGIPTGWEVVLDLIRKLAHLQDEDCEPDPAAWFKEKIGKAPEYSELLEAVARSQMERQQLHKGYFEPTEEERERGQKVATTAHKAIAKLVSKGYFKVIITTNFDRLLERSLEEVGVTPLVISTPDAVKGAIPIVHSKCTIIKVNGDYLDPRLKITEKELSKYDKPLNRLLDQILDEFGLIVCGWSAEWDIALRESIERCKNHRFITFWAAKGEIGETARKLAEQRPAQIIPIIGADSFFGELAEKVSALEELSRPHPLSVEMAIASLKKYIPEDRYIINLHDLVMAETEKLYSELNENNFPLDHPFDAEQLRNRVQKYEALSELLLSLMINGCYWGNKEHEKLWVRCLERIANPVREKEGGYYDVWLNLKLYPALLLLYGGGIASVAAEKYNTFSAFLSRVKIRGRSDDRPAFLSLNAVNIMEKQFGQMLPGMERKYTPLSDHLYGYLRRFLREFLPDEIHYEECFDKFEYLLGLVVADRREKEVGRVWGPAGRFGWRYADNYDKSIMNKLEQEIERGASPLIDSLMESGLFEGSADRFKHIKKSFDAFIKRLDWS